jgi:hypothetical protein
MKRGFLFFILLPFMELCVIFFCPMEGLWVICILYFVCPEVVRGSKSLQIVGTYRYCYAQEDQTNKTSSEALKRRSIRIITPKQISLNLRRMFWK